MEGQGRRLAGAFKVPGWVWRRDLKPEDDFWDTGYLQRLLPSKSGYGISAHYIELFDVRFWMETLLAPTRSDVPSPDSVAPELAAPADLPVNRGGRPLKPYWEDLLVEMFDRLWHGTLTPEHQSDMEEAMHLWIQGKNFEASSVRSVRERARKIWNVWIKDGKN